MVVCSQNLNTNPTLGCLRHFWLAGSAGSVEQGNLEDAFEHAEEGLTQSLQFVHLIQFFCHSVLDSQLENCFISCWLENPHLQL